VIDTEATRCGFVALIGAPNAGKSTLLNALVGSKVSIVSRKAQTTRNLVRGVAIEGRSQLIFVDTPGIFAPRRRLDRAMVVSAWSGAGEADVVALLVDASRSIDDDLSTILDHLTGRSGPRVLVLNKIDLIDRPKLLGLAAELNGRVSFIETFMISALKGDGLDRLRAKLADLVAPGPWLYPEDQISDAPLRSLAAEITREKIFERLHDELPYHATVETESWRDLPDGSARVEQVIFVTRDAHKKIVLGAQGRMIKSIGSAARKDIAEAADQKIHLFLFVKVREHWMDDPERYREMGLDMPKR
jgi:GTPase